MIPSIPLRTPDPFVSRQHFGELYFVCFRCPRHPRRGSYRHKIRPGSYLYFTQQWQDWCEKHKGHCCGIRAFEQLTEAHAYTDNADVKEAMQAEQSMTVTNLHSLASSATAGWSSASVDNSSNLYLDSLVAVHIAAVNTAPGNNKAAYHYAYGSTDGTIFTSTGTSGGTVGTEGTLTFPSIATPLPVVMPLIGVTPYPVQNKAIDSGPYSVAKAFGGILPVAWGIAELNYTGMTYAASGNTRKYRGQYNTVI